jgi:hypothetical protein
MFGRLERWCVSISAAARLAATPPPARASPELVDFGRVQPVAGTVSASVTITDVSADNLPGGRYVFLGDTNPARRVQRQS